MLRLSDSTRDVIVENVYLQSWRPRTLALFRSRADFFFFFFFQRFFFLRYSQQLRVTL